VDCQRDESACLTMRITRGLGRVRAHILIILFILNGNDPTAKARVLAGGQRVAQGESASPGYAARRKQSSPRTRGRQRLVQGCEKEKGVRKEILKF